MVVLPFEDLKANSPVLVGDTVVSSWAKHNLGATHEIIKAALDFWNALFVELIQKYVLVRGDLEAALTLRIINKTSIFDAVILGPNIVFNFEEKYLARRSSYKNSLID